MSSSPTSSSNNRNNNENSNYSTDIIEMEKADLTLKNLWNGNSTIQLNLRDIKFN